MISVELYRDIRECAAQGMSLRSISKKLGISRKTAKRYGNGGFLPGERAGSPPSASPMKAEIQEMIRAHFEAGKLAAKKQRCTAKSAWDEIRKTRDVGLSTVQAYVREMRLSEPDIFIPLSYDPGAQAQVDWGEAKAHINGELVGVTLFCMVLSYSNRVFVAALPDQTTESLFEGHCMGLESMGGVPAQIIYDNMKTAVLTGSGSNARKQKRFELLEAHYAFEAVFCSAASGWEKGKVENLVKTAQRSFFTPMPRAGSLKEIQCMVEEKCLLYNSSHKIKGRGKSVAEMHAEELPLLRPLPLRRIDSFIPRTAKVYKDLCFRLNETKYSLPREYAERTVTLRIHAYTVEAHFEGRLIFTHNRALRKGDNQYIIQHYLSVLDEKRRAVPNAAPLREGLLPAELDAFRSGCREPDKYGQLLSVIHLMADHGDAKVLKAVATANSTGRPTFHMVLDALGLPGDTGEVDLGRYDDGI
jgi:transposase